MRNIISLLELSIGAALAIAVAVYLAHGLSLMITMAA